MLDLLTQYLEKKEDGEVVFGTPQMTPDSPTEKQVSFYKDLVMNKVLTDSARNRLAVELSQHTRKTISEAISWLITFPWKPKPTKTTASTKNSLAPGRYAILHSSGELLFYQIDKPIEGKWAGMTFVNQLSGDNRIPVRDKQSRESILSSIQLNPIESLKLYGQKIGRCGHCKKTLTDSESREFGIGPVCRKSLGL